MFVFPRWENMNLRWSSQKTNIPEGNQMKQHWNIIYHNNFTKCCAERTCYRIFFKNTVEKKMIQIIEYIYYWEEGLNDNMSIYKWIYAPSVLVSVKFIINPWVSRNGEVQKFPIFVFHCISAGFFCVLIIVIIFFISRHSFEKNISIYSRKCLYSTQR